MNAIIQDISINVEENPLDTFNHKDIIWRIE
jgi:hypothetical protein